MTSPKAETALDHDSMHGRRPWAAPFPLPAGASLPYEEAIAQVEAALRFGIDPSLEPVRALLAELGHPESSFLSVQVAGTNGKTSTSRYTAALIAGEGFRCGLYTSPHLVDYAERVEIGGAPVSHDLFARGVSFALEAWRRIEGRGDAVAAHGCTEFELLTAAAMVVFAEERVDYAVLECGLGGRWDATSAVPTCAATVTGIGFDHMGVLGDTLGAIASEKAAVLRRGIPCVLGTNAYRPREVLDVMARRCEAEGVVPTVVMEAGSFQPNDAAGPADDGSALTAARTFPVSRFAVTHRPCGLGDPLSLDVRVEAPLPGGVTVAASYEGVSLVAPLYQAQNVACALALATATLGRPLDPAAARASIASCHVPGRFEVVGKDPLVILDACHNPQSAAALAQAVCDMEPVRSRRPVLLLGALADKDHAGIASCLAPLFERVVVTQSSSPRALPAEDLAREVEAATGSRPEGVYRSACDAVLHLCGESFIGCGTITLIGELAALLK